MPRKRDRKVVHCLVDHKKLQQECAEGALGYLLKLQQRFRELDAGGREYAQLVRDFDIDHTVRGTTALWTVMECPAAKGKMSALILLLSLGANPNQARRAQPALPLSYASALGQVGVVAGLLAARASVDAVDADGRTALHWAVHAGHDEVVAELLLGAARTDVGAHPQPLYLAASKDRAVMVEQLVAAGALPLPEPSLAAACMQHSAMEALRVVVARGLAHGSETLVEAVGRGHADAVEVLLAMDVSACSVDADGTPVLLLAIRAGMQRIAELLAQYGAVLCGADVGALVRDLQAQRTALHAARVHHARLQSRVQAAARIVCSEARDALAHVPALPNAEADDDYVYCVVCFAPPVQGVAWGRLPCEHLLCTTCCGRMADAARVLNSDAACPYRCAWARRARARWTPVFF